MVTNPFGLGGPGLTPEQVAELASLQKKQSKQSQTTPAEFVKLPYEQTLAAAGRIRNAQLAVLVELAHQRFKTHENPVSLDNKTLEGDGDRAPLSPSAHQRRDMPTADLAPLASQQVAQQPTARKGEL
jgi:hypothetical protein